jgi:HAD superfamily hydrolase (TIGR01509 family)
MSTILTATTDVLRGKYLKAACGAPAGVCLASLESMNTVLLDVDGTLIDSNDAHAQAWVDALAAAGHAVPFERVRSLIGKGGDKLLWETVGIESDAEIGKRIDQDRSRRFKQSLPNLQPFPGARALLQRMYDDGLRLVAASSAKNEELHALLEIVGADFFLYGQTSSDDADNSKPDPDIVQAALRRAHAQPSEACLLGDTPYDVEAAARAGVATVALRCGGWSDAELEGAVAIFADAAEVLAHYAQSPFGQSSGARASADDAGEDAGRQSRRP